MNSLREPDRGIVIWDMEYVHSGGDKIICELITEHAGEYGSYYLPIYKSPVMPKEIKPPKLVEQLTEIMFSRIRTAAFKWAVAVFRIVITGF